jgi:hypothetical protein
MPSQSDKLFDGGLCTRGECLRCEMLFNEGFIKSVSDDGREAALNLRRKFTEGGEAAETGEVDVVGF